MRGNDSFFGDVSAVSGTLIPSGWFGSNSKVVRGQKRVCVPAHRFVLGAEHRHRHCGHQNRTLAVIHLSQRTGEQSAMEEQEGEEEEESVREGQRMHVA